VAFCYPDNQWEPQNSGFLVSSRKLKSDAGSIDPELREKGESGPGGGHGVWSLTASSRPLRPAERGGWEEGSLTHNSGSIAARRGGGRRKNFRKGGIWTKKDGLLTRRRTKAKKPAGLRHSG